MMNRAITELKFIWISSNCRHGVEGETMYQLNYELLDAIYHMHNQSFFNL